MTPAELAADLRTRINPVYAAQLGTESYERRLCAEAIEGLIAELAVLKGQQAIGSVTVSPWRGLENIEWQQSADIPEGTHMLYLAAGAQPVQEPVAWGVFHKDGSAHIFQQKEAADIFGKAKPLYLLENLT